MRLFTNALGMFLLATGAMLLVSASPVLGQPDPGGCETDADCDDGRFCTGVETCVDGTCVPAGTGVANGTFQGPSDWTPYTPVGGTITFAGELAVVGANEGTGGFAWASQSGVVLNGVNLKFDLLSYASDDSDERLDYPVFLLDGVFYGLNADGTLGDPTNGDAEGTGTINNANPASNVPFEVDVEELTGGPGPYTIGFGVNTVDGLFGPGTAVFDNVFPEAGLAFPCPELGGCDEAENECVQLNITMSLVSNDLNPAEGDNVLVEVFAASNGPVNVSQFLAELPCEATGGATGEISAVSNIEGTACTGDANDAVCPGENFCVGTRTCYTGDPVPRCGEDVICVSDPSAPGGYNGYCEEHGHCEPAPHIDESRGDYIFADATTSFVIDGNCSGDHIVNVASVNLNPGSTVLLYGLTKYLGRFLYTVDHAVGQFQLDLLDSSRLLDAEGFPLTFTMEGLTFEMSCATDDDCDNGDFCDGTETCAGATDTCRPGTPPCPPYLCDEPHNTCNDCLSDGDCDDGNECTDDVCTYDGTCESTNKTGTCDDGDACTVDDECAAGVCAGTAIDCDDGNECTDNVCTEGTCESTNKTGTCDDGDACTVDDECAAGECVGTAIECDDDLFCNGAETCVEGLCVAGDDPCPDESCDEENEDCVECLDDADCDDGDPCTEDDTCTDGECAGTEIADCETCEDDEDCDDDDACTDDSCDATGKCVHDTIDCDDGDGCTNDSCDSTDGCVNTAKACDDGDACTDDSCSAGVCAHDPIVCADSDNNPCTIETCQSPGGVCVTVPIDCDDGDPCTDDTCSGGNCIHTNNFADCDDGNVCTETDVCDAGVCAGEPIEGCQTEPCVEDVCAEEGGSCVNGDCLADCDDDNPCGENETCVNGHCYGACAGAGDCDDGVFCNGEETCVDNACGAGDPASCPEGEECDTETDMCEEVQGICGSGFGCTTSSPLMGLTLLALFCLRGTRRSRTRNS